MFGRRYSGRHGDPQDDTDKPSHPPIQDERDEACRCEGDEACRCEGNEACRCEGEEARREDRRAAAARARGRRSRGDGIARALRALSDRCERARRRRREALPDRHVARVPQRRARQRGAPAVRGSPEGGAARDRSRPGSRVARARARGELCGVPGRSWWRCSEGSEALATSPVCAPRAAPCVRCGARGGGRGAEARGREDPGGSRLDRRRPGLRGSPGVLPEARRRDPRQDPDHGRAAHGGREARHRHAQGAPQVLREA